MLPSSITLKSRAVLLKIVSNTVPKVASSAKMDGLSTPMFASEVILTASHITKKENARPVKILSSFLKADASKIFPTALKLQMTP